MKANYTDSTLKFLQKQKSSSKPETNIASRLWANGEFTTGLIPPKRKSTRELELERLEKLQKIEYWVYKSYRGKSVLESIDKPSSDFYDEAETLGLSILPNSHKSDSPVKRARRGLKGISSYQKRVLRNAVYLLSRKISQRKLGFGTCTLPAIDRENLKILLTHKEGWAGIVRKFLQELQRELRRKGAFAEIVACTEIQEKRYLRRKEVAPHLHFVYHAHEGDYNWFVPANKIRAIWRRILENAIKSCDLDIKIDEKASVDTKLVKKNVEAYLTKYLSKGGKILNQIKEAEGEEVIPTGWAHCTLKLKRYTKSQIRQLDEGEKIAIFEKIDLVARGYLVYLHQVEAKISGELRTVGFVGKKAINNYTFNAQEMSSFCS